MMVATRKLRGNYTPTETQKKTWAENKIDTSKHWTKTNEGKQRISKLLTGRIHSAQSRANMSRGARRRLRTKRETLYTSAKGGYRSDLCRYFRSCWEANFARILNVQQKTWQYEEHTFQLENSISYTPDFYVIEDDIFYELKGRMDDKSQRQLELMKTKFSHIKLEVIDSAKYKSLKAEYHDKIAWEGK